MPLQPGTRLGPYEIVSPLGTGGMGEVYKARDTRLDRFVAIKVLPTDKQADQEHKRRFIQEAKAASALNHPNIVTIYDVGSENGVEFLAMELVPGKTLEDLIPRDGFRLPEMLRYAVQAADALAKAHAAGIVHRDLKVGNIMVTPDGLVKVLDFGLAKLVTSPVRTRDDAKTVAPAAVAPKTDAGLIVGTTAFMSPEQAEGRPVDARSDIFSFGAVLYEMATGQRAFSGETVISTISAILRDDPKPVSQVRPGIPSELDRVIRRCLRKDAARRFQTMGDLKVALEELKEESDSGTLVSQLAPASVPARSGARWIAAGLVLGIVLAAGVTAAWMATRPSATTSTMTRPAPITAFQGSEADPSFSPDGSQIVFSWNGEAQDNYDIYVKVVGPGVPLRLTTDRHVDGSPSWSPDGRTIAFLRNGDDGESLILMPPLGGAERTLAKFRAVRDVPAIDWSPDGKWIVAAASRGDGPVVLQAVSVETGEVHALTALTAGSDGDATPSFSPDGKTIVFGRSFGVNLREIWRIDVSPSVVPVGEAKKLPREGLYVGNPIWSADGRDLIYTLGFGPIGRLMRMPADGSGPSHPIAELGDNTDNPARSRAGGRLAFTRQISNTNIWRLDLQAKADDPRPFISSTSREAYPHYSPDGKRIVFYSARSGSNQIWVCDADGSRPTQLTTMTGTTQGTPNWSPDGRQIVFDSNQGGDWQIYVMDAEGGPPRALTHDKFTNVVASWSNDGKWIYFLSRRSGNDQIWKIPSQGGEPVQVTRNGGGPGAMESPDGKWLYFGKTVRGNDTALWRMPAGGGEETRVIPMLHRYNFFVTPGGIYYDTSSTDQQPASIEFLSFATNRVTKLYTFKKPVDLGLGLSPDGRYLLFAQFDLSGSDLWFVENFK